MPKKNERTKTDLNDLDHIILEDVEGVVDQGGGDVQTPHVPHVGSHREDDVVVLWSSTRTIEIKNK
jgi:hypothetical protein